MAIVGSRRVAVSAAMNDIERFAACGDSKFERPLFWTVPMLELIQTHATRCDKSLSFMVQHAWTTSYPAIAASDREALANAIRAFDGKKAKQSLYFRGSMIAQFLEQSTRFDASESFVVQAAVALAQAELEKLPSAVYDAD